MCITTMVKAGFFCYEQFSLSPLLSRILYPYHMARVQQNKTFEHAQLTADSHHPERAQSIILSFALHSYIL